MNTNRCEPKIDYPCPSVYKLIGRNLDDLNQAIVKIIGAREHTVTLSQAAGRGLPCLNVTVTVKSESVPP